MVNFTVIAKKNVKEMTVSPLIRESRRLYLPVWAVSFFSLFVSVWLFQMLKWIISQKLLNVQWKVVTETLVSDFSFSFQVLKSECTEGHSISLIFGGQNKITIFASPLFKGLWRTQELQGQLEGLHHRAAGSLAEYCSFSLSQCLSVFGTQVIKTRW